MQALGPTVNPQELGVFLTLPFYEVLVTSERNCLDDIILKENPKRFRCKQNQKWLDLINEFSPTR